MFDPFNDFEDAGYLRNHFGEKDPEIIRELEHTMFRAGLDEALAYIETQEELSYGDFLEVHRILFSEFYPWAGMDRAQTAPDCSVSKAGTIFSHPYDAQRAVELGLRMAQDTDVLRKRPGEVMGLFAYGHPFLDGNGRTMLLIHSELCHRAGFRIEWERTNKADYLRALSAEIASPTQGHLDSYLSNFVVESRNRELWGGAIDDIQGLDGQGAQNTVDGEYSDKLVHEKYEAFKAQRSRSSGGLY